ncbi:hypothetical protein PARC_b0807 [Pseudoalteromonas arctica A 37-1-2]|uniref:Uncharacterized protein n=1 Tax=Pseudoalteromonas arctica A 37-1-2 TaxID=1117313 RepID=A0A290SA49_9GAMM|nr:hypothetical protein PARC_b0807 [Pseudoalteromonas arctica A 37-1-2]
MGRCAIPAFYSSQLLYQSAYIWGLFNVKKITLELGKIFVSSCSK